MLQTSEVLTTLVRNGSEGKQFPCDGIEIGCFLPNSSVESRCIMTHSVGSTDFDISVPDRGLDPSASCYWVPVSEITEIEETLTMES